MDDPGKKGTGPLPGSGAAPVAEADEFASLPRPRTRHPLLALGAALLALFLVVKMRADLTYYLSPRQADDLGEARELVGSERGRRVLDQGTNRLVRVRGVPDRESALQVDTRGSWTFTQFFKILGTDSCLFVHRRENPLPAARAEHDVFEGRLMRFADLSFQDSIRAYFAAHVSTTHFFTTEDLAGLVRAGADRAATVRDLTGDTVSLAPNDILAIDLRHPGEIEVSVPVARFHDPLAARAAVAGTGAAVTGPGRARPEYHTFVVTVADGDRDRVLDALGNLDARVGIEEVRETVSARLSDLTMSGAGAGATLAVRGGGTTGAGQGADADRPLTNIATIRTLATVQIPPDAYLIVEGEGPREHTADVAIALVLLVFAAVNLVGLARGLRR